MTILCFSNPGEIDRRLITTMGVNVKDGASPIGFFGTGLKYSIAVWLRLGCQVKIQSGLTEFEFATVRQSIRGKEFEFITMLEIPPGEALPREFELGFTTELGKAWEPWMAYRELWSNAKDEGGTDLLVNVAPVAKPGHTRILVSGQPAVDEFGLKGKWLVQGTPDIVLPCLEIRRRPSEYIYYQGIRVTKLGAPSMFTYNIVRQSLTLTEDRTLDEDRAKWFVFRQIAQDCKDLDLLRQVVTPEPNTTEENVNWVYTWAAPSADLVEVLHRVRDESLTTVNKTVFRAFQTQMGPIDPEPVQTSPEAGAKLISAMMFLARLGYAITQDIVIVKSLGERPTSVALGAAFQGKILLPLAVFDREVKFLAAVILEEYLHLAHGLVDETRTMQTFLLEEIIRNGERALGVKLDG